MGKLTVQNNLWFALGVAVCGVLFASSAFAEYRVFELAINDTATGQGRVVKTTLDDLQYRYYFPLRRTETVQIQDTWMCRKRSDISQDPLQRYCDRPVRPK